METKFKVIWKSGGVKIKGLTGIGIVQKEGSGFLIGYDESIKPIEIGDIVELTFPDDRTKDTLPITIDGQTPSIPPQSFPFSEAEVKIFFPELE